MTQQYVITVLDDSGKMTKVTVTAKSEEQAEKIGQRYGRIIMIAAAKEID